MSIGIGQILLILLVIILLFGKLPNLFQDVASGIRNIKNVMDDEKINKNEVERIDQSVVEKRDKNEEKKEK
jgi:TatA/E family protein of Tat protein translocase